MATFTLWMLFILSVKDKGVTGSDIGWTMGWIHGDSDVPVPFFPISLSFSCHEAAWCVGCFMLIRPGPTQPGPAPYTEFGSITVYDRTCFLVYMYLLLWA